MERVTAGYRTFTGYELTQVQADAYNAAVERAERCPSEANRNGAHNLLYSLALTGMQREEPFKFQNKTWCGAAIGWRAL